ncbi:beta strand repeat-containing protein [Treponema sp. R80B11-R83G3]
MRNGEKTMKNMKYGITFGIALVCAMLFTACDNVTDTPEIQKPVESGYGRISISFTGEDFAPETAEPNMAKTVLPQTVFDKYVYTFTKTGETGVEKEPDSNGYFTLEVGNYTVAVQAYIGTTEPYALAASGESAQFSVGSGSNTKVSVPLTRVTAETEGKLSYTITYPVGAEAVISLKKWSDMTNVPLNPVITTQVQAQTRQIKIDMYDSYGDGWNGGALRINVNGTNLSTNATISSVSSGSYIFNVVSGDSVSIYWVSGSYQYECSFIMYYTDTPPSPIFNTSNNSSWNGTNALLYRLCTSTTSGTVSGTLQGTANGALLGSFTVGSSNAIQGNGKTQTLELEAGSYLFTVLVSKTGLYAGLSEAVHINPLLTTIYTKNFIDSDLVAAKIPLSSDYTISGTGSVICDGSAKTVSVTPKTSVSPGNVTVYYTGTGVTIYEKSTTAPVNRGTYIITFDVAAATGFAAATGLPAGTLTIDYPTPAVSDYTITGTGTFTYNGTARTVTITPKANASPGTVTILYNGTLTDPVNVGEYPVTFNVEATSSWNAANGFSAGNIIINKAAGATVSASTGASTITGNSITINAVTAPSNGQTVEYALSTSTTTPSSGWQDGTTFNSLNASTSYYIYARTKANTNYNAGTAIRSTTAVTTLHVVSSVTANGSSSPKTKTTTLTFNFSGNPGTVNTSNISLSGNASIGSATISGSGNTRTLSPITLTGTNTTSNVTVTFTMTGVVTYSTTVTVYNPITAGLYAKAPPVSGNDSPVNLSSTSGTNIVDQAFNYINANAGTYTLVLDSDISVAGHSTDEITNVSATRHLKVNNAKLTIIGMDAERKISVTQSSGYGIFAVGRSGYTGIELTIGNNITLVGTTSYVYDHTVQVQNGATFTMKDNATMSGNYNNRAVSASNSSFTMQDTAKITSYGVTFTGSGDFIMSGSASIVGGLSGGNITMSGNALLTGGINGSGGYITMSDNTLVSGGVSGSNRTITMSGNSSVSGGVSGSGSTFTMSNSASVIGGVDIGSSSTFNMKDYASVSGASADGVTVGSSSKFTMLNNAKVFNNGEDGVYVTGSGSEFTMSNNSSVFGNVTGVYVYSGGTFIMQDSSTVSNNTSYGVYVEGYSGYATTTFTMKNNASVSGNTAYNGGGVYVKGYNSSYRASFIMQDNASVSGNTATNTGTTSGGGGVYVTNYGTFEMKGGLIWGNKATGASSNGGGVYVYNNGTFTMSGGTIYGTDQSTTTLRNTTAGSGASLYVNSSGSAKFASNNSDITTPGTGRDTTITVGTTPTVNVTVTYNINGGTGTTPAAQTVSAGSSVTLPSGSGLTKTGYTFNGWYTSPSGLSGTHYNAGTSYTPVGTITLYAHWVIVLTANTWKDGTIPTSSDVFSFTATAATQYIHVSFGTLTDLYVQVYDASSNTVGSQTYLYGNTKSISRTLTVGEMYYIRVSPYGSNSGTYKIAFNTSSTAPTQ